MNNSLRWKLILAFVLVFLAGAACGFFGAFHAHYFFARMGPGSMAQHMKQRLRAELKLTPEQMQQISPIIDHAASQLKTKRSEEHTSELQSHSDLVCRLLLEKKKNKDKTITTQKTKT